MKLLTKAIEAKLPPLYSNDALGYEAQAIVKFFTPDASWTWYATEYDPNEHIFFGLVDGLEIELGYFSLDELQSIKGSLGLSVERDIYFSPTKLSTLMQRNTL